MSQSSSASGQPASFSRLGLSEKLLRVLQQLNFTTPTPIQAQAIPVALEGRDVIGIAQTGTGKTLSFSLPMIESIAKTKKIGLVVVPTRELAEQVNETLEKVGSPIGLKRALLIGGSAMNRQINDLKRRPHVIVGTPGRINDHLERGTLKLHNVGVVVLDEADRMLDMGFAPQIKEILKYVPRQRQTLLFSATMPPEIARLTKHYMKDPARIQVAPQGTVAERVHQELYVVPHHHKLQLLDRLLSDHDGTVLVFSRTKYGARKVCRAIKNMNHSAAEIHSNLTTGQRRRSLAGFKSGEYRVMVATDIAARGIDVADIALVVNFDLPDQLADYVHRVGRTGRAGKKGHAISFVCPDQRHQIRGLERLVKQELPVLSLPILPPVRSGHNQRAHQSTRPNYGHNLKHRGQTHKSRQKHRGRRVRVRV